MFEYRDLPASLLTCFLACSFLNLKMLIHLNNLRNREHLLAEVK